MKQFILALLLLPSLTWATSEGDRVSCMEALSKYEAKYNHIESLDVVAWEQYHYIWDGQKIVRSPPTKEIWNLALFRSKKADGRVDENFPSEDIRMVEESIIKVMFADLREHKVTRSNVRDFDSYYQQCKNVTDVTLKGKGKISEISADKLNSFPKNEEFAEIYRKEAKPVTPADK